jgi:calcineurin-like phosphoesterase
MSESGSGDFINKFKNYSLNILIVILAALTIYLFYNFVRHSIASRTENKPFAVDSTSSQITKQPSNKTLQIDVQNGTGVQGVAGKVLEYLRSKGFDVVEMGNFSSQDIKTSMVIDRTGNTKNANLVAQSLGISEKNVIEQVNRNYFLDATVVIGRDYLELKPFKENRGNNNINKNNSRQ